jgi:Protein of unknown function (DUF4031)
MPVYVDEIMDHTGSSAWCVKRFGPLWCHMFADSLDELHALAAKIGMKRSWFQGPPKHHMPHYDLTPARQAEAIAAGAILLDYDKDEDIATHRRLRLQYRGLVSPPAKKVPECP